MLPFSQRLDALKITKTAGCFFRFIQNTYQSTKANWDLTHDFRSLTPLIIHRKTDLMMWLFLLRSSWLLKAPFLIPDGPGRGLKLWLLWLRLLATSGRTVPGAEGSPGLGLLLLVHSWSRRGAGLLLLALMALAPSLLILMVRLLQLCQQRLDGVVSNTSFPTLWNNIRLRICIFCNKNWNCSKKHLNINASKTSYKQAQLFAEDIK